MAVLDPPASSSPPNAVATIPVRLPSVLVALGSAVFSGGAAYSGPTDNGSEEDYPLMGAYWGEGIPPGHTVVFPTGGTVTGTTTEWDWVQPGTPPPSFAVVSGIATGTGTLLVTAGTETVELTGFDAGGYLRSAAILMSAPPESWMQEGLPFAVQATGALTVSMLAIECVYPIGSCYATDWMQPSAQNITLPMRTGASKWQHYQAGPGGGSFDDFETIFESSDPGNWTGGGGTGFVITGNVPGNPVRPKTFRWTRNFGSSIDDQQDYQSFLFYTGEEFIQPGYRFNFNYDPELVDLYVDSQGYEWEGAGGYGAIDSDQVHSYGSPEHFAAENATGEKLPGTGLSNVRTTFDLNTLYAADTTLAQPSWTVFNPGSLAAWFVDGQNNYHTPESQITSGTPLITPQVSSPVKQSYSLATVPEPQHGVFALGLGLDPSWQGSPGWLKRAALGQNYAECLVDKIKFYGDLHVGRARFLYQVEWTPGSDAFPFWEGDYGDWRPGWGYQPEGVLGPVVYPEIRGGILVIPNPADPDGDPWAWATLPPGAGLNDWMQMYLDGQYIRIMYGGRVVLVWRMPHDLYQQFVSGGAGYGFYNPYTRQWSDTVPEGTTVPPWRGGPTAGWSYLVDTRKWVGEDGEGASAHGIRIDADDLLFFPDRVVGGQALQDDVITSAPVKYLAGRVLPDVVVDSDQAQMAYDAGYWYALYPIGPG